MLSGKTLSAGCTPLGFHFYSNREVALKRGLLLPTARDGKEVGCSLRRAIGSCLGYGYVCSELYTRMASCFTHTNNCLCNRI